MADATQSSSQGAAAPASSGGGSHESGDQSPRSGGVREQDRFLPIANISRIMKKALPANGKIAKDSKETVQECVSEFISFITSEASDKCQREKRKTINGDDLLWAMATLGFEEYVDPLKVYLTRYREMEGDTKGSAKGADGSAKRDASQLGHSSQLAHHGSFTQGINYGNSQELGNHIFNPRFVISVGDLLARNDRVVLVPRNLYKVLVSRIPILSKYVQKLAMSKAVQILDGERLTCAVDSEKHASRSAYGHTNARLRVESALSLFGNVILF
ncbi:hypothetical protein M9H77_24667 [Catharanthus roseus]|uniref:Uncharacterized protein n=1 Tax=Catharanthus roseus TaxID=4058 RepID=A0ACC0AXU1_CATRO|nr:hypothetical protein M9H77_24667 [Catharanthus roseus]